MTNASRTTSKESRLAEYLETLDAPRLTDEEIALIDEAGAKEHHRQFVRRITLLELKHLTLIFYHRRRYTPRKGEDKEVVIGMILGTVRYKIRVLIVCMISAFQLGIMAVGAH